VPRWITRLLLNLNAPLLIGGLLVVLLAGAASAAPLLAQRDPLVVCWPGATRLWSC
jgi:hypothetical protein